MNPSLKRFVFGPLRAVAIAAALCAVTLPGAAASEDVGDYYGTVMVPEGVSGKDVQQAIISTLIAREWGVKKKSDGAVVGYLKHRRNEATVTLTYDKVKVDIHCIGWAINKRTGERKRPELPMGWLKNIQTDLTKHLNLAATNNS